MPSFLSNLAVRPEFAEPKSRGRRMEISSASELKLDLERHQVVGTVRGSDDSKRAAVQAFQRYFDHAIAPESATLREVDLREYATEMPFERLRQLGIRRGDLSAKVEVGKRPAP